MVRRRSSVIALALGAALLVAACGGNNATQTPGTSLPGASVMPGGSNVPGGSAAGGSAAPGGSAQPGASVGLVESPLPDASDTPPPGYVEESPPPIPTPTPVPSPTYHVDTTLQARLPSELRGVTLAKSGYGGEDMPPAASDPGTIPMRDLLDRLGKKPADLKVATATDPTAKITIFLMAIQITGAPGKSLLSNYLAVSEKYTQQGVVTGTASLGGKKVNTLVVKGEEAAGTSYFYVKGDTIYIVQTADQALAADALKAMP